MRIFYYFRELDTPMYWWQRTHWISELESNGHEVITFNPLDYSSIEEANEKCLERIRNTKDVDLFLTCVDQDNIYRCTFSIYKKTADKGTSSFGNLPNHFRTLTSQKADKSIF